MGDITVPQIVEFFSGLDSEILTDWIIALSMACGSIAFIIFGIIFLILYLDRLNMDKASMMPTIRITDPRTNQSLTIEKP